MSEAFMRTLARAAASRYDPRDRFARHFAYGKLKGDPVFRHLLQRGLIPNGARVLDLGCGQGLLAAVLATARELHAQGGWPAGWPAPPTDVALRGVELAPRDVARASAAGGPDAGFIRGDIRSVDFGPTDLVMMVDVLHYIDHAAQDEVLRRARGSLANGGALLLRVADADGSLRFRLTELADRLAMRLRGRAVGRLASRPLREWRAKLEALGFAVESIPMSEGTPFANFLLVARYHPVHT